MYKLLPETKEEMIGNLREADEGEAHAEAEQTTGASNVRDATHLFSFAKPLCVGLLKVYSY